MLKEMKSLVRLDLSYNHFTNFNIEPCQDIIPDMFPSLQIISLRHNNLFSIGLNQYFPNLKVLDLSSNNFCSASDVIRYQSFYQKKCLILSNKNQYLSSNPKLFEDYIAYLKDILSEFDYEIRKLDFSYLNIDFDYKDDPFKENFLNSLIVNKNIQYNVKKLNFSFCNVTTSILSSFFNNNTKLINLKVLNLRNNNISDDFLANFLLPNENFRSLENLEFLDLSENHINRIQTLNSIFIILNEKNHIKKIKLNFNEIEILINNYVLVLNTNSDIVDEDLDVLKKFLGDIKLIPKRSVSLIFSKLIENNVTEYFKKTGLDKIFTFE